VIHDHLQQLLSLARINLGVVASQLKAKPLERSVAELDGLIAESLEITRSLTAELSPAILHRNSLATAFRWLGRWFARRFGLDVSVEADDSVEADEETRVALYRAARELLFNVVKHARVSHAALRLGWTADGRVRIVVSDEGVGFDPDVVKAANGLHETFGLYSLGEQIELIGGRLELESAPGRGATLTIVGPARPAAPGRPRTSRTRRAARKQPR
jgi:signal transduction histidine kinase